MVHALTFLFQALFVFGMFALQELNNGFPVLAYKSGRAIGMSIFRSIRKDNLCRVFRIQHGKKFLIILDGLLKIPNQKGDMIKMNRTHKFGLKKT